MIAAVIADIIESLFGGVLRAITGWLDARAEQKQGAVAQASRDTAVAEKTVEKIDQAEANAEADSDAQLVADLKAGKG